MFIDTSIRSGNDQVDKYIEDLEGELTRFEASNVKRLIESLDSVFGKICEDLDMVSSGADMGAVIGEDGEIVSQTGLTILTDSKDDKLFDRIMTLVTKINSIKDVYTASTSLRLPVKEQEGETKSGGGGEKGDKSVPIIERLPRRKL